MSTGKGVYTGRNRPSSAAEARARAGEDEEGVGAGSGAIKVYLETKGFSAVEGYREDQASSRRRWRGLGRLGFRRSRAGGGGFGRTGMAVLVSRRRVVMEIGGGARLRVYLVPAVYDI